jgi:hypothetical protein
MEVWCHLFLSFTLDGVNDELHVTSALFPGKNSGIYLIGWWMGTEFSQDVQQNRKFLDPAGIRTLSDRPSSSSANVGTHKTTFLKNNYSLCIVYNCRLRYCNLQLLTL